MKQTIKSFPLFLLLVLFVKGSFGQSELPDVKSKLLTFTKNQLPEKLFIHTDKSFYTAGEVIWFKIYVVDGVYHKILPASKVAYIELLDKTNTPVLRTKVSLNAKGGNGSFQLPISITSGNYTIRGYTNWMKNEEAATYFEERITVVNTLKSPEAPAEKKSPENIIQLFPEGGNIINNLPSKIAFHLTDQFGKGIEGKGYLVNQKNDTLSSFVPYKFGMGHFVLTPQNGDNYKVIFKLKDDSIISRELPKRFENGYTMQLEETENDKLKITVRTNVAPAVSDVYLLTQTRRVVKSSQKKLLTNGFTEFIVNKQNLGEGVSQLTVFDGQKRPVCERLYFIQPKVRKDIAVNSSKSKYTTREKVELFFSPSYQGKEIMSLAVFQLDGLQDEEVSGINEYLWLTSELTGIVEQPSYYFSNLTQEVKQAADYLMLTNGWRRFKWGNVFTQNHSPRFQRELHGHIVIGKVTDVKTNTAVRGVDVFLTIPNSYQKLFTSTSDSLGYVQFDVRNYFGQGELIVQTDPKTSADYKVEIVSPFSESYSNPSHQHFTIKPSHESELISRSISMQANHLYSADITEKIIHPLVNDTLPFYGKPLYSYNLEDFVRFNTMEEVLREYVREINVGVKGSGTSLRFKLFNENNRELYTDDILVMVDGIPLFNPNTVFSVDPLKIKQLDVINRNYVLGNSNYHGLANFTSYNGSYGEWKPDPKTVTIDYEGLQLQREFYSPEYSSAALHNSRIPDLRHTLFWTPDIHTEKLSFYTGDNKGKFLIVLQGIDPDGHTISASAQFEVQ